MNSPATKSGPDLQRVFEPSFWLVNRNRLIGIAAAIGAAILIFVFARDRSAATEQSGWRALVDFSSPEVVRSTASDDPAIKGTEAEPYALLVRARDAYASKDYATAESLTNRIATEFKDHPLQRDPNFLQFVGDIKGEREWQTSHPERTANPPVGEGKSVVLQTEAGDIKIGLYTDQAPNSCRLFLNRLRAGALGSFTRGEQDQQVELVIPKDPAATSDADLSKDQNLLSHFAGAISFAPPPEGASDAEKASWRISFCISEDGQLDHNQAVFGSIVSGADLLKTASARLKKKDSQDWEQPLVIKGFSEDAGLKDLK